MGRGILIFLVLSLFVFCVAPTASAEIQWISSYDQALSQAKTQGKPIMVDFYTDWCGWCKKLDSETYQDSRVIQVSRSFVCLKIDADKNKSLVDKYKVSGYPTILFLNSSGNKIGGRSGFRNADELLSEMEAILSKSGRKQTSITTGTGKVIKSTVSSIGAFAKNWWWSKERNQDGEYAETKVNIKLPQSIKAATLVLKHSYSQQSGTGSANVYISTGAQVAPKDDKHYKGNWWVGEGAKLGPKAGSFETQYSKAQPTRIDITTFVKKYPSGTYYIAVQNLSGADIGISQIYIEIEG